MKILKLFLVLSLMSFELSSFGEKSDSCKSNFSKKDIKPKSPASKKKAKEHASEQFVPTDHPDKLRHFIDHTNLKPNATKQDIEQLIEEAIAYKFKAICVHPCRTLQAAKYLKKRNQNKEDPDKEDLDKEDQNKDDQILQIATVVGFPLGTADKNTKMHETKQAHTNGADEIDMVINLGFVKDRDAVGLKNEITAVVNAAKKYSLLTKVIIETDMLTEEEIVEVSKVAADAGADFVKTSTGFVPDGKGALMENIELMQRGIKQSKNPETQIKASGGVKNLEQAKTFIEAGVTRLGTSSSVQIIQEAMEKYDIDFPEVQKPQEKTEESTSEIKDENSQDSGY